MKEEIKNLKTSTLNPRFQVIYQTLLLHCWKCRKNKKIKNPTAAKTKRGKPRLLSKYTECDSENQDLLKSKNVADYYYHLINI